jgi:hypothetical protein
MLLFYAYTREIADWIKNDLDLIDRMFLSSPHIELIQRLPHIIVFLLECEVFSFTQDFETIWSVLLTSQHRSMNQGWFLLINYPLGIFTIFVKCLNKFSHAALNLLIDKCRMLFMNNVQVLDESFMNLLRSIIVAICNIRSVCFLRT